MAHTPWISCRDRGRDGGGTRALPGRLKLFAASHKMQSISEELIRRKICSAQEGGRDLPELRYSGHLVRM